MPRSEWLPRDSDEFVAYLVELRARRQRQKKTSGRTPTRRRRLAALQRATILASTAGRCHVCGGTIRGPWEADHVLARSAGGRDSVENHLPAHETCNNYRWDYLPEEFQEILRLGVWLRTQIERQTQLGRAAAAGFLAHEKRRLRRRRLGHA